jgi:hypothetical protein
MDLFSTSSSSSSRGCSLSLPFLIFQYIKQMSYENTTTNTSCTIIVSAPDPADVSLKDNY